MLLLSLLSFGIFSCNENDEGLKTPGHDKNEMMTLMHDMK